MDSLRILLYSLIFLLSVFGNLLIIVVLVVNKRMRTVTNSFLLSLAISDLMMAVVCMPFTLIPNLLEDFIFGAAMCKIVAYLMGKIDCHFFTCTGKYHKLQALFPKSAELYGFNFFFFPTLFSLVYPGAISIEMLAVAWTVKLSHYFLCKHAFFDFLNIVWIHFLSILAAVIHHMMEKSIITELMHCVVK